MARCYFCKGTVKEQAVCHVHQWRERVFIFDNVPAEVCTQCGEMYFGPEALEQMDKMVAAPPEPEELIQVPVYSLKKAAKSSSDNRAFIPFGNFLNDF
jgi:YgiT-type zinc finger domain-containing protein